MTRKAKDITDAELAVLETLWERGSATIRQVTAALYPQGSTSSYATVQKLLERLEGKGFVDRDRSRNVHLFSPRVQRDSFIGRWLKFLAERFCKGSHGPLLTHLIKESRLSEKEREELKMWLKIQEDKAAKGNKRSHQKS